MSDNKTMIRFYSGLFLTSALLTYAVDLNSQFHFIAVNSPLISNSFCFAILSGVLTGIIVALVAEVRLYLLHKRQSRNALFAVATELYGLISVQRAHVTYYINDAAADIPENIGDEHARQPILVCTGYLKTIDYSPFSKKDHIRIAAATFYARLYDIESGVRNLASLQIAHTEVQKAFLKNYDVSSKVTASSPLMLSALQKQNDDLKICLDILDEFCGTFEQVNNNHFNWQRSKEIADDLSKKIEADPYFRPDKKL